MASGNIGKGSKEWQMFKGLYIISNKFWIPEDNDEYWEHLVDDARAFSDKYKQDVPVADYWMEGFLKVKEHEMRGRHTRDEMRKAEYEAKKEMEKRMHDRIRREICET